MGGIVRAGGDHSEIPGVQEFPSDHTGQPGFTFSHAIRAAERAEA